MDNSFKIKLVTSAVIAMFAHASTLYAEEAANATPATETAVNSEATQSKGIRNCCR